MRIPAFGAKHNWIERQKSLNKIREIGRDEVEGVGTRVAGKEFFGCPKCAATAPV